jgi:long-subunit acyl-CoA synthetase (AMP-forming)
MTTAPRQLERFENLVALFLARAAEKGDAPFLSAKRDEAWRAISWSEAARQVSALAGSAFSPETGLRWSARTGRSG